MPSDAAWGRCALRSCSAVPDWSEHSPPATSAPNTTHVQVVLVWDGLSAHWSRAMRAWVEGRDWLTLERLPAYAPELNPVEMLWSPVKTRELANVAGDHLADVADAAEQGINRVCEDDRLPWSFLAHTGLEIQPPTPRNQRKTQ
ncbi:transposase [Nocardiopsis akebiae]|uniref:transposase n=1 Tax=Nocardiopsis akebiae TaxID=2831968 RepID=UPI0021115AC0|nr:transposase [Nocardiopsis akebiae]